MKIATFLFLMATITLTSCMDSPNFPSTPQVSFAGDGVRFYEGLRPDDADSLQVSLKFEDAEGDLGLDADEMFPPYNLQNYYNNKTGRVLDFSQGPISVDDLMTYKNRDEIDTLPPFEDPYSCIRWTTQPDLFINDTTRLQDTVYFQFNPRHHNFFVKFFIEENGEFEEFDFRTELDCSINFDGRFPLIKEDSRDVPKEGTITYNMQSPYFLDFFGDQTLQLKIRIVDRAGHYSQWLTTQPFTLRGIQAN